MEWQPIETAPMDGSWILTYTNLQGFDNEFMAVKYDHNYGWSGGAYTELKPTHWMPLPEPPQDVV